jgi:DNA-binding CsgD family transcriptional regulator
MAGHRDDRATADRHLAIIGDEPPAPGAARAKSGWVLGARALTAERAGRPGESAEILSVLLTPEYEQDLTERHIWLPLLTRLALAAGDPDLARRTVEAQAERERLPRIRSNAAWCRGLLDGDPEPVRKAVEYNRASGRVLEFGLASEDVAQVLASGGDLDGARAALAQAMSAYADLGAVWDGMRAAARMRPFGIRPGVRGPRRRPQSGWEALTETELRVAELVATGRSNPDIAAQLFLSRRTIDTHVSHILAKLDARSRREIASLAAARATTSHDEPRGRNDQEDDAA